jgi:hypothetical protein
MEGIARNTGRPASIRQYCSEWMAVGFFKRLRQEGLIGNATKNYGSGGLIRIASPK